MKKSGIYIHRLTGESRQTIPMEKARTIDIVRLGEDRPRGECQEFEFTHRVIELWYVMFGDPKQEGDAAGFRVIASKKDDIILCDFVSTEGRNWVEPVTGGGILVIPKFEMEMEPTRKWSAGACRRMMIEARKHIQDEIGYTETFRLHLPEDHPFAEEVN